MLHNSQIVKVQNDKWGSLNLVSTVRQGYTLGLGQGMDRIKFHLSIPGPAVWNRVLSFILVMAILGALGMLGYVIATPVAGEKFTEFYILGLQGKATDYPTELKVGEEGKVIVGIVNQEQERVTYRVKVRINGEEINQTEPIMLEHGDKSERIISFTPTKAGEKHKVEFLLYKDGKYEPCLEPLHLWLDVTE